MTTRTLAVPDSGNNVRAFGLLGLFVTLLTCAGARAAERPNIVLILADDLGIGDVGCYNPDSRARTPNVDRLANEGVRLTDAHSPSAVCTPTRYGVLTGRYAWRTRLKSGVLVGTSPNLIDTERETVADVLHDAGYRTGCFGKWHLGLGLPGENGETDYSKPLRPGPLDHGFDTFFGIPASLDFTPYVFIEGDRPVAQATAEIAASQHRRQGGGGFWRGGPSAPGFRHVDVLPALTERAVAFIDRAVEDEQPFFLYVPLTAPHTPWVPTGDIEGQDAGGIYCTFVTEVDATVGAILARLDRHGLVEDTLVVVTSDNGAHWPGSDIDRYKHAANLDWRGQKADIWEGGHRVPFVARWPGSIPKGKVRDELVSLTDLFATFASVSGTAVPAHAAEDSIDQSPVLMGEALDRPPRDHMVQHSIAGHFAIRKGSWKLIPKLGSGGFSQPKQREPEDGEPPGQLYNLAKDPREQDNLWSEQLARVVELATLLEELRAEPPNTE